MNQETPESNDPSHVPIFEVYSYESWLSSCKLHHPTGRLNKKGNPDHIVGYGEEDDQEWLPNIERPDMQSDLLGCWSETNQFGWFFASF